MHGDRKRSGTNLERIISPLSLSSPTLRSIFHYCVSKFSLFLSLSLLFRIISNVAVIFNIENSSIFGYFYPDCVDFKTNWTEKKWKVSHQKISLIFITTVSDSCFSPFLPPEQFLPKAYSNQHGWWRGEACIERITLLDSSFIRTQL